VGVPEDIAAIGRERPEALVLPKARSAEEVRLVLESLEQAGDYTTPLVATIEDAIGVFAAPSIATASARVGGLGLGAEDMSVSLNVRPSIESLAVPAQMISMAAASAGIPCFGIPGSLADYTNLVAFEESARRAKALGFWGALCVHPGQVPIANAVFSVSPEEVAWARKVLERAEATVAVGSEVGMIDAPVILRARRLMERSASNVGTMTGS